MASASYCLHSLPIHDIVCCFHLQGSFADCQQLVASLTTPAPTVARGTTTENPQNITATQDQTIATLRAQFRGLRASHEAHVSSLAEAHAAEVASLRNYTRLLDKQLAHRSSLHRG